MFWNNEIVFKERHDWHNNHSAAAWAMRKICKNIVFLNLKWKSSCSYFIATIKLKTLSFCYKTFSNPIVSTTVEHSSVGLDNIGTKKERRAANFHPSEAIDCFTLTEEADSWTIPLWFITVTHNALTSLNDRYYAATIVRVILKNTTHKQRLKNSFCSTTEAEFCSCKLRIYENRS